MTVKIRVDISCYVDIDATPEFKELVEKRRNTKNKDTRDEITDKIYEYIDTELTKKGFYGVEDIYNWDYVAVLE